MQHPTIHGLILHKKELIIAVCALFSVLSCVAETNDMVCSQRMLTLWRTAWLVARRDALVEGNPSLPISNRIVSVQSVGLPVEYERCPRGGVYRSFYLNNGPQCPSGHQMVAEDLRQMHLLVFGPRTKAELFAAVRDSSVDIRASVLYWIPTTRFLRSDEKTMVLKELSCDQNAGVRNSAVAGFGLLTSHASNDAVIVAGCLEDPDLFVRIRSAQVLGELGDSNVVKNLEKRLVCETNETVRSALEKAIKIIRTPPPVASSTDFRQ